MYHSFVLDCKLAKTEWDGGRGGLGGGGREGGRGVVESREGVGREGGEERKENKEGGREREVGREGGERGERGRGWGGGGRKKLKKLKVHIFSMCMTPSHVKLKNAKFSTQNILYGGLMDVSESAKEQTRGTWFHWA